MFYIHIIHSNKEVAYYYLHFLSVFKLAKGRGLGQNFNKIFHDYLKEKNTYVFTTEEKYLNGKKDKILHVVDENYKFKFLDDKIENAGQYGVCH